MSLQLTMRATHLTLKATLCISNLAPSLLNPPPLKPGSDELDVEGEVVRNRGYLSTVVLLSQLGEIFLGSSLVCIFLLLRYGASRGSYEVERMSENEFRNFIVYCKPRLSYLYF